MFHCKYIFFSRRKTTQYLQVCQYTDLVLPGLGPRDPPEPVAEAERREPGGRRSAHGLHPQLTARGLRREGVREAPAGLLLEAGLLRKGNILAGRGKEQAIMLLQGTCCNK